MHKNFVIAKGADRRSPSRSRSEPTAGPHPVTPTLHGVVSLIRNGLRQSGQRHSNTPMNTTTPDTNSSTSLVETPVGEQKRRHGPLPPAAPEPKPAESEGSGNSHADRLEQEIARVPKPTRDVINLMPQVQAVLNHYERWVT